MRNGTDRYLEGLNAVVAGGAGNVGTHIVDGLLAAGATVIVPSRAADRLARLRAELAHHDGDRLLTLEGTISDEEDGTRLLDAAERAVGPLHAGVASLGGWVSAPSLLSATRTDLERALEGYLLSHFMVARAVIPRLEGENASYTFINGPLAFRTAPGTALVSIATAGQAMLARALMQELEEEPVRVQELVMHVAVGWGDEKRGPLDGNDVGRYLAHLIAGRDAEVAGGTVHLESPEQMSGVP